MVITGLSNAVRRDARFADRIRRVPSHQKPPLPLDDVLDGGVSPDAGVVVGSLPVHVEVEDEPLVIAQKLLQTSDPAEKFLILMLHAFNAIMHATFSLCYKINNNK